MILKLNSSISIQVVLANEINGNEEIDRKKINKQTKKSRQETNSPSLLIMYTHIENA